MFLTICRLTGINNKLVCSKEYELSFFLPCDWVVLENQRKLGSHICPSSFPLFMSVLELAYDSLHQAPVSSTRLFYEPVGFKSGRPYQTSLKLGLELTSIASTLFYGWNEVKELLQIQEDRKYTLVSRVPCVHIGKWGMDGVALRSVYISLVSFRLLKSSNL